MAKLEQIVAAAQEIVKCAHRYLKVTENKVKRGGYLAVVNHQRPELTLVAKVGQVSKEKTEKYNVLAREKAWRLYVNSCHSTSYESRNEKALVLFHNESQPHRTALSEPWGQWGGAVRGNRYIFSFSGFPELLDEAMMFALAIKLGELNKDWVIERFATRNEYLVPFLTECGL